MISLKEAVAIQEILIEEFGGSKGIRDRSLLESAINRPYQTFDNKELYPSAIEKAAAIIESIVTNHPFIDGNKRVGYVFMRLTLMHDGVDIDATEELRYQFVIQIAEGKFKFPEIQNWIIQNLK